MHDDYRKSNKTGTLALSQSRARNLATGIGQSADAAMYTGGSRSMRVATSMPMSQKKALCKDSGYPESYATDMIMAPDPSRRAANQTKVNGKVP